MPCLISFSESVLVRKVQKRRPPELIHNSSNSNINLSTVHEGNILSVIISTRAINSQLRTATEGPVDTMATVLG